MAVAYAERMAIDRSDKIAIRLLVTTLGNFGTVRTVGDIHPVFMPADPISLSSSLSSNKAREPECLNEMDLALYRSGLFVYYPSIDR